MIRVLHSVSNMDRGGIETMLMNYYRHIDREKVQFDFIVNKKKPGDYDDEIRRLGGHIYQSPGLNPLHYPAYLRFVQQTVAADPRIRILHAHNEAMGLYALKGAEKAGLQVRIAHAHNIWIVRDYKWPLKMFCKQLLPGAATHLWACGRDAGIYYFGKADWERRGQIIPNAIEPETFRFSPAVRAEMRARYGLEDRVVLGHVGRFDVRKNHERLLEIFAAFLQLEPRAMLVLIGTGRLEQAVRAQAQELGITDHILFAGLQSNVADWYQMMDLFVMPSRFEGLPVVGIEAQAAGLGCVFSDAVPAEVLLSSHAIQIPLSASNADWAAGLQRMLHQPCDRSAGAELIRQAGYDINQPYPFHNDILKVFVEVGFPGFLLWSSIQYVLTPLFWQRYADQETTLLYLSELGYMTVTYLTDNTAFYFWSTMALRLVTLAYAMERKKPPEPKVWMPDSRQEMRDLIHILMKKV